LGKTYKQNGNGRDYDDDNEDYEDRKQNDIDKRKKKRIARALRLKDLDALMDEDLDWEQFT
jgi:predicted metal-dependent hydrolase